MRLRLMWTLVLARYRFLSILKGKGKSDEGAAGHYQILQRGCFQCRHIMKSIKYGIINKLFMEKSCQLIVLSISIFLAGCSCSGNNDAQHPLEDTVPQQCRDLIQEKDACISDYAKEVLDPSFCSLIKDRKIKDSCYLVISVQAEDEHICRMISELLKKEGCLGSFAQKQRDENKCNELKTDSIRNECLEKVAIDKGNVSICRMIGSGAFFDRCISRTRLNSPWLCFEIGSYEYLKECLGNDYFRKNNETVCEVISSDVLRQRCFERFEEFS